MKPEHLARQLYFPEFEEDREIVKMKRGQFSLSGLMKITFCSSVGLSATETIKYLAEVKPEETEMFYISSIPLTLAVGGLACRLMNRFQEFYRNEN